MVSIIVACWARADLTRVCIDSILAYTKDFELICVQEGNQSDNLSYLPSMTVLLEGYEKEGKIKYVQNKIPKGYAGALNAGLKVATGDYFCFMNNDTVVTPGWMDEMLKAFEDKEVGLVSPTFWGTGDRQSVDWNTGDQFDNVVDPCSIIGVCYLISKECMDKVGIWDESFGHGGEDFDMTIRVQNAGYMLKIARKAFIYHYGGASTRILIGNDLEAVRANQVAKIKMVEKKHGIDIMSRFNKNISPKINVLEEGTWKGKRIKEMTRDEIIDAWHSTDNLYTNLLKEKLN
jgi:GT2 family glycosyltransferase